MPNDADVFSVKAPASGLLATLKMTRHEVAKERVVVSMEVGPHVHQLHGILHGGASVALAETAASIAANVNCEEGYVALGQEINANHLRSMRTGTLTAVALPVHIGRRSQVWGVEIRDEAARLVCVSRCTLAVVERPAPERA